MTHKQNQLRIERCVWFYWGFSINGQIEILTCIQNN